MNNKLNIYILVDNVCSSSCNAEHGLSYVIDFDHKVLFDTGQSDLFMRNAQIMKVNLDEIETVVLSHGHFDHGNGLMHIKGKELICHPDVFLTRFSGKQRKPVGLHFSKGQAQKLFQIRETRKPFWISERMVFLGEIPRKFDFEKRETKFYLEDGRADRLMDDSALAIIMQQGLFVISGCAHSGICNILEYAKKITHENRIYGVLGGFHLKQQDKHASETLAYFKQNEVKIVMPSHCTELPVLALFYEAFGGSQVKAGNSYTFNETQDLI